MRFLKGVVLIGLISLLVGPIYPSLSYAEQPQGTAPTFTLPQRITWLGPMKQALSCSRTGGQVIALVGMDARTIVGITACLITTKSILQFVAGGMAPAWYVLTNTRNIGYERGMTRGLKWGY